MKTLKTPRIETVNLFLESESTGIQKFQVIKKHNGQEVVISFRSYEDAEKYYNTL